MRSTNLKSLLLFFVLAMPQTLMAEDIILPAAASSGYGSDSLDQIYKVEVPMLTIATSGDLAAARQLFSATPNIQMMSASNGDHLISQALTIHINQTSASYEFVKFLLDNGADPNATGLFSGTFKSSPLMNSLRGMVRGGHSKEYAKIFDVLVENGADVNDPALILLAYRKDLKLADKLVKLGAEPNPVLEDGQTVLDSLKSELNEIEHKMSLM